MTARKMTSHGPRSSRGVSLIIVLILMIIIGITASTAMRNASSEQRATNNQRMEATALQYAEAALRFCEAQMKLPVGSRVLSLQGTIPALAPGPATSGWEDPLTWTNAVTGRASSTRTPVLSGFIQDSAVNTVLPTRFPECVVETQTTDGVMVITARGFSTDYEEDIPTGRTRRGAVVWLQSFK